MHRRIAGATPQGVSCSCCAELVDMETCLVSHRLHGMPKRPTFLSWRMCVILGGRNSGSQRSGAPAMTFDEILAQIIDLLKRQGRVSYRALKMRFNLDDEY